MISFTPEWVLFIWVRDLTHFREKRPIKVTREFFPDWVARVPFIRDPPLFLLAWRQNPGPRPSVAEAGRSGAERGGTPGAAPGRFLGGYFAGP